MPKIDQITDFPLRVNTYLLVTMWYDYHAVYKELKTSLLIVVNEAIRNN